MIYENVFEKFAEYQLRYLVIGGIAVNFHGFARATSDLDILMVLSDEEILKFIQIMQSLQYTPRLPVALSDLSSSEKRREWIEEKNMKVFSLIRKQNPMETIDLMIHCPLDFDAVYDRRVLMPFQDIEIPVASIPDLIELKTWAGRERDLIDIKALKKIQEIQNEQS